MGFFDFLFGKAPKANPPQLMYAPGQEGVLSEYFSRVGQDMPWLFDTVKGSVGKGMEIPGKRMGFKIGDQTIAGSYNPRDIDIATKNSYLQQANLGQLLNFYGQAFRQPQMSGAWQEPGQQGIISDIAKIIPFFL